MQDTAGVALRVLRWVGSGVAAVLEYVNLRDGLRGLRRDARRGARRSR
ncbi:hypothetical protein [Streptomyces sp. NPDC102462]